MEDIIKELYDLLEDRIGPDREIILEEVKKLNCEIKDNKNDPFRQLCARRRLTDLMDLLTSYTIFRDKVEKVKGNINYDKNH